MNPANLRGLAPEEFERLCLELVEIALGAQDAQRCSDISTPDQGVDIEASLGSKRIGVRCMTGRLTVPTLRDTLRRLIGYPHRMDHFIIMCAQYPAPDALDEFGQWAGAAKTAKGAIAVAELWNPERIVTELNANSRPLKGITQQERGAVFGVPVSRPPSFIGREPELDHLHELMNRTNGDSLAVSIVGFGGAGKTVLAAEYAYRYQWNFPGGVYWMNGQENILAECARFAVLAEFVQSGASNEAAARAFLDGLRAGSRALLVIDDLDRPNLLNEPLVDDISLADCGCKILITSRFAGLLAPGVLKLQIATLTENEAVTLLATVANRPHLRQQNEQDHLLARELCQELGFLPMAIHVAGTHLTLNPQVSVGAYLQRLRERGTLVGIDESEVDAFNLARTTLTTVNNSLRLAYESIRNQEARELFQILSILPEEQVVTKDVVPLFLRRIGNGELKKALAWLMNTGFIDVEHGGRIRLHPIARAFGRSLIAPDGCVKLASSIGESVKMSLLHSLDGSIPLVEETSPPAKIFICYAGSDRARVERLYDRLAGDGFEPWMDKKSLLPGQDWRLEIRRSIETADFFVACISRKFQERTYGHKEIKLALKVLDMMPEGTIFLIPLRLEENCTVDERLATRHWVDYFEADGYGVLLKALRQK